MLEGAADDLAGLVGGVVAGEALDEVGLAAARVSLVDGILYDAVAAFVALAP